MVGPGRQLTSLRHCSRACDGIFPRWFKNVNLVCAKKVYYSNRPNYFFSLRQQQNHEQHF